MSLLALFVVSTIASSGGLVGKLYSVDSEGVLAMSEDFAGSVRSGCFGINTITASDHTIGVISVQINSKMVPFSCTSLVVTGSGGNEWYSEVPYSCGGVSSIVMIPTGERYLKDVYSICSSNFPKNFELVIDATPMQLINATSSP